MDETPDKPDQPTAVKSLRRRWYQFTLRTLLIGVALLSVPCAYVAHEYRIVQARKEWITDRAPVFQRALIPSKQVNQRNPASDPSLIRRWLGDKAETLIDVDSEADSAIAKSLFPEAAIKLVEDPDPEPADVAALLPAR